MPRANRTMTSSTLQTNVEQSAFLLTSYLDDDNETFYLDSIRECRYFGIYVNAFPNVSRRFDAVKNVELEKYDN